MSRAWILPALLTTALSGCGLAATGAAAAPAAAARAQQAAQARQTEERVRQDIDAAYQRAAERRRDTEAEAR